MNSFGINILECYKIDYSNIEKLSVVASNLKDFNFPHAHYFFHYSFVTSCKNSFIGIENKILPMKEKTFYLFKPGEIHSFFPGQNVISIELKFSLENEELLTFLNKLPNMLYIEDPAIDLLLNTLLMEYKQSAYTDPMFYVKFYELLILLSRINDSSPQNDLEPANAITRYNDFFKELLIFLQKHYDQDISLDDMADFMDTEKKIFVESFKKNFNCSPMKYLNIIRVNEAMNLLEYSNLSVDEIAAKVGYLSASSLSSFFKHYFGIAPTEYRKQIRQSIKHKNSSFD